MRFKHGGFDVVVLSGSFHVLNRALFPSGACGPAVVLIHPRKLCVSSDRCLGPRFGSSVLDFQGFRLGRRWTAAQAARTMVGMCLSMVRMLRGWVLSAAFRRVVGEGSLCKERGSGGILSRIFVSCVDVLDDDFRSTGSFRKRCHTHHRPSWEEGGPG